MKAKLKLTKTTGAWQLSNILKFAAQDCGLELGNVDIRAPHIVQFRLRLYPFGEFKRYQRTSYNPFHLGRKVNAVCWHGFRDFIQACYLREPSIEFTCSIGIYGMNVGMKQVKYYSLEQFNMVYPETDVEVGGDLYRAFISQCCTCVEGRIME